MKKFRLAFFSLVIIILIIIICNLSKPAQKNKTVASNSRRPKDTILIVSGDEDKKASTNSSQSSVTSGKTTQSTSNSTIKNYQKYTGTWKIINTSGHTTLVITSISSSSLSAKVATVYGKSTHISNAAFKCALSGSSGKIKFTDTTGATLQGTISLSGNNIIMDLNVAKSGKGYSIQTGHLVFRK